MVLRDVDRLEGMLNSETEMARIGDAHATGMKHPQQVPGAIRT